MGTGTPKSALHGERKEYADLRLTIQNDLGELARVHELANAVLVRRGVGEAVVYATQLALEEVLSNVIRHGFQDGARHEITLVLRVGEGGVELQINDDGSEFNPMTAPKPKLDLPLALRPVGGMGIHLLRAFTREIRYERRGERNALSVRI